MNTSKTNKKILLLLTFIILSSNSLASVNLKKLANGYKNIYFLGNVDEPKKFLLKFQFSKSVLNPRA